ncbi:MAG: hypothetical protein LIO44_01285, partial [Eubacterium sp.]|nr:hypothetical protein [Eubacterium sp.]
TSTVYINSAGQSLNAISENILPFDSSSGSTSSSGSSSGSTASSGSLSGSTAVNTGGSLLASALDSESSSYNVTSSSVY